MINVWGDSIATGVVAHLSCKEVTEYEEEQNLKRKLKDNKHEAEQDFRVNSKKDLDILSF